MSKKLILKDKNSCITFSAKHGAVKSLVFLGNELLTKAGKLFSLGMRNTDNDLCIVSSDEFTVFEHSSSNNILRLSFSETKKYSDLKVTVTIRVSNGFFYFSPDVEHISKEFLLEWIDAPQISVKKGKSLFWPRTGGIVIDNPELRERTYERYHVLGFLDKSPGGYYPGICQMQFIAYFGNGKGVYFAAHDHTHGTKGVEFAPDGKERLRLSLQTFCGEQCKENYKSPFEYVLGGFCGDWMDACSIYRNWIKDDPMMPKPGNFPAMIKESPVIMIYPVRGDGDDKGEMKTNDYFPYERAMPVVRNYAEKFESKIMSLLMHWEGTAPWAPPYVWPPLGGEKLLDSYGKQLHDEGHYLGVYCSGTAWTQTSSITNYSREVEFEQQNLQRYMIRGPHSEINALICNGPDSQRIGFDICLTEKWSQEVIRAEVKKLAKISIDYAQFFDQNLGGSYHPCYSKEHDHPPVPGSWQTHTMSNLLKDICNDIRKAGSNMVLGCEAASADVYMKELLFNDLRPNFTWHMGIPVPGYSFVFHEYSNNFMGNQCGIADQIDCVASPENLLFRTAYTFNAGDLLSVLLKDNGKIHWGWIAKWDMHEPNQDDIIVLIKNLNQIRKKYPDFLQYGKMMKPLITINGGKYTLKLTERTETVDSFFHSSWLAPNGTRGEFITNFMPNNQIVFCNVPVNHKVYIGNAMFDEDFELQLSPLNAVYLKIMPTEKNKLQDIL
jgi:Domain of unknown function (DUF6259)